MKKVLVLCSMIIALGFVGCTPKAAPKKAEPAKPATTAPADADKKDEAKPAEAPAPAGDAK